MFGRIRRWWKRRQDLNRPLDSLDRMEILLALEEFRFRPDAIEKVQQHLENNKGLTAEEAGRVIAEILQSEDQPAPPGASYPASHGTVATIAFWAFMVALAVLLWIFASA